MTNLRRKAIVASSLVLLSLVWLAAAHFTRELDKAAMDAARSRAKSASVLFAEQVTSTIAYIDSLLKVTARDMVERPSGTTLSSILAENPFAEKNLVQLAFADSNGVTRETENGPSLPIPVADREHIRVHLDAAPDKPVGLFIGKPVLGRVSNRWSIQITRSVFEKNGSMRGVLVYSLDPLYFERFLRRLDLGDLDRITLLGADGVVRMQSQDTLAALAAKAKRDDIVVDARRYGSHAFAEEDDGERYVSYVQVIPDFGLFVSTRVSEESVAAEARERQDRILGAALFVSLLIGAMGLYAYRSAAFLESEVQRRTAELQKAVSQLDLMSQTDPLTETPNRRAFDARLNATHREFAGTGRVYALLLLDIDHFKSFNDRFGHDVGDMVLCGVAKFVAGRVRKQDFFARIGGEEFALIMPDTSAEQARDIAERLRLELASGPIAGHEVTISIGIGEPRDGEGRVDIYRSADQALYRAKMSGRNRVTVAEREIA